MNEQEQQRREAHRQANAIVGLAGWEPSREALAIQEKVIRGELTHDEAVAAHIAQAKSGRSNS